MNMTTYFAELETSDIVKSIGPAIENTYARVEWEPENLGLPSEYEIPILTSVDELTDLKVISSRKINASQYMVWTEAHIVCNFEVEILKAYYPFVADDPGLSVRFHDWDRHFVLADLVLSFDGEIDLLVESSDDDDFNIVGALSVTPKIPEDERPSYNRASIPPIVLWHSRPNR